MQFDTDPIELLTKRMAVISYIDNKFIQVNLELDIPVLHRIKFNENSSKINYIIIYLPYSTKGNLLNAKLDKSKQLKHLYQHYKINIGYVI